MRLLCTSLLLLVGCAASAAKKAEPPPAVREASSGIRPGPFATLLQRHWDATLEAEPVLATRLGDHRFDAALPDRSPAARARQLEQHHVWLAEARALPAAELHPREREHLSLFIESLESSIEIEVCAFPEWRVSARSNAVVFTNELSELHPVPTPADGERLLQRYRGIPGYLDTELTNLRRGLAEGHVATEESLRRVLALVDGQLALPAERWPMAEQLAQPIQGWPADARARFTGELRATIEQGLRPAFTRYAAMLRDELLPRARPEAKSGLSALSFGPACYSALIRHHTTLPRTAAELHQLGRQEVARIDQEMEDLGRRLFAVADLPQVLDRLRQDRSLYFTSADEVESKAREALERARRRLPEFFGLLPRAECVVTRVPDYEAPFTTIAYYRQPMPDGKKPGQYFVNVHQPETRPRYEAEVLAFHESIPGHHLQIAIAQERPDVPAFLKHEGMQAFVEGWALYTERLAEEMGLYSSDLDRLGRLSFEAWRASRLVVDTGIHAMGWSRQAAKGFMLAHTALAPNNIDNEVDRYISTPGQALAYKTGQLEILRLRALAQAELGPRFRLPDFHDVVLGGGAVSLPLLSARVTAWLKSAPR